MGPLLSTHPVARRHFGGVAALVVSLFCSLLIVLAFVLDFGGAELALLAAAYPMLISVPAAVVMLRNARIKETFELHEGGLARVRAGVRQAWTWDQVRAIDVTTRGTDLMCAVRFDDDELISFSGSDTDDSLAIHDALFEHRSDALEHRAKRERRAALVSAMSAITLAGAGGAGAAAWVFATTPKGEGAVHFGLAMFAVVGFATAVITGILLIAVLLAPRPD
ncbi:hypothetical protein ACFOWZ_20800 [Lentzea rhizosphaerae]|uniref:PH domain-containing protein n=1 Tax=Lentzea rhizosphaerae TaxID=2041025 RepID=A0ABV8BUG1_9PSEU